MAFYYKVVIPKKLLSLNIFIESSAALYQKQVIWNLYKLRNGTKIVCYSYPVDSDDSIINDMLKDVLVQWIVSDFEKGSPPNWFYGFPILYSEGTCIHEDSYHLYYLKEAYAIGKLPSIKTFLSNSDLFKEAGSELNFGFAYSRYFC
ncbi:MAG: hypothetical protein IPH20_04335 [Bacteroidales bacterium]|nr:hypothetical protein [Bacteroidales bacterium]